MNNEKQENKKVVQNDSDLSEETVTKESKTEEQAVAETLPKEIGGRTQGLEPTRYGDWEFKGRCIDF